MTQHNLGLHATILQEYCGLQPPDGSKDLTFHVIYNLKRKKMQCKTKTTKKTVTEVPALPVTSRSWQRLYMHTQPSKCL